MTKILKFKPKELNIGVIIQARMTSKRFPGKVLTLLNGEPILKHVIRTCTKIKPIDKIIVAVPDTIESESILKYVSSFSRPLIYNFCGPENDVLKRYYDAAMFFKLDIICRVTADCPFLNHRICKEVLDILLNLKLDYCSNVFPKRTFPQGFDFEVFTMDTLEAAYFLAKTSYDREHVTSWMQREKELKRFCLEQRKNQSSLNLCVDVPLDISRLETLIKNIKSKKDV